MPKDTFFPHSGAAALTYANANYYAANYHDQIPNDEDKLERYFFLFGRSHFGFSEKWLADCFDTFPRGLMKFSFSLFGSRDYTGHLAITKGFARQHIEKAIQDGAKQILLMEGSFNSLSIALHNKYPDVHFFEISYGKVRQIKQDALAALRSDKYPSNAIKEAAQDLQKYALKSDTMHYVEADIRESDWLDKLKKAGFDPAIKSIASLSSLPVYATPEQLDALFPSIRSLLSNDSTMITAFIPPLLSNLNTQAGHSVNKIMGAKYKMTLPREDAPKYLLDRGFVATAHMPTENIYTSLGFTEAQGRSNGLRTNFFVTRPKQEGDELKLIDQIPVIDKIEWKHPEPEVVHASPKVG